MRLGHVQTVHLSGWRFLAASRLSTPAAALLNAPPASVIRARSLLKWRNPQNQPSESSLQVWVNAGLFERGF